MQRRSYLVVMALAALVVAPTEAAAESMGRTCRRICRNEVQECVAAGGSRAACRRTLLAQCRREGASVCLDAGEESRRKASAALYAPVVLNAVPMTSNRIDLTWNDSNTQEHGYSVERSMNGVTFAEIVQTGVDAVGYSDPGRLAATTYHYRVRSFRVRRGRYTFSEYSTVASAATPPLAGGGTTTTVPPTTIPTTTTTSSSTSSSSTSTTTSTVAPTTTTMAPTTTTLPAPTTSTTSSTTTSTSTSTSRPPTTTTSSSSTSTSTSSSTSSSTSTSTSRPPTTTTSSSSSSTSTSSTSSTTSTTAPNQAPQANAGPNQATQTLTPVAFNGSASFDPDGTIVGWAWSFGDGASGSGVAPSHAYGAAGTYVATLTVTDNKGATGSDTSVVTIANRPPVANAGANQTAGPGAPLVFNGAGSSDPDGTIISWSWSFGDGTTATGAAVTHAYATSGTYTVTLTVQDNNGAQASDTTIATVTAVTSGSWADGIGSDSSDAGYAVATDGAGNVIVGGTFRGTVAIGADSLTSAGGADWFLAKYDPNGTPLWAEAFGGASDDYLEAVAIDGAGDVVVAGRIAGTVNLGGTVLVVSGTADIAVAKYAGADGAHRWSKRFGGVYDDGGIAVAADASGNVYVTGYFRGTVDFGGGILRVPYDTDLDVFVVKLDAAGAHSWSRNFPNTGNDRGYGIAVDGQGGLAVVGSFSNGIDFGGGELVSQNAMIDAFVAKLATATGAYQWARDLGAPDGNEAAYGVTFDGGGKAVVSGYALKPVDFGGGLLGALGGADGFVAAYQGATGAHVWSRRLGGATNDYAYNVARAPDGGVVVTGAFEGTAGFGGASLTPAGSSDAFVAKYTGTGAPVWARGLGGIAADVGQEVAVAPAGNPVVAGYFYGTGTFGGTTLSSAGMADAFVTKLTP